MITALVGVWAAYNQEFAWTKFWILASAVLLFYSLAGQPAENIWFIGAFFVGLGTFAAVFFMMGHDWIGQPLKIEAFNRLGEAWMAVRPKLSLDTLHPNSTGTFVAMFFPIAVAITVRSWRQRRVVRTALTIGVLVVMATALILTTSRGAWLGLSIAAGLWVMWVIVGRVSRALHLSQALVFAALVVTMLVLGVTTIAAVPNGVEIMADSLPGPPVASSRLELLRGSVALAGDFPFTGGGLGSFPGLFSHYFRGRPLVLARPQPQPSPRRERRARDCWGAIASSDYVGQPGNNVFEPPKDYSRVFALAGSCISGTGRCAGSWARR